jgi:hypothetical protein
LRWFVPTATDAHIKLAGGWSAKAAFVLTDEGGEREFYDSLIIWFINL